MKNTNQSFPNDPGQPNDTNTYNKTNNSTAKTLVAIAAGAAAGAVTAMLLTPKNGLETRKVISDSAARLKDGVTDSIKQGIDKLGDKLGQAISGADRIKDEALANMKTSAKTPDAKANNA